MPDKIKVFHFHNGTGGGVLSVIRNLLLYRQNGEIENHVIYTINNEQLKNFKLPGLNGAASEQVFYYSSNWNFYYTCRQLSKLIPDDQAVIVAHDWLELGMVSNLGLQNPVVQFLHGNYDYYFNLSQKHSEWVDAFVCVAAAISQRLKHTLPQRTATVYYKRLPVPEVQNRARFNASSKIVFIGRCENGKGYNLLPVIAEKLLQQGKDFEWHIIGEGSLKKENQTVWPDGAKVFFYGVKANEELLELMSSFNFLILPSLAEGMPLTVIEAMKAGVVSVVNDLPGGLQEIIMNGETGFRIENNNVDGYVEAFINLQENKQLANEISTSASLMANASFNPITNTAAIENVFLQVATLKTQKPKQKLYGSRLDEEWIPNGITTLLRRISS